MSRPCRKCGSPSLPPKQAARGDYRCAACTSADSRAYRAKNRSACRTPVSAEATRRRYERLRADPEKRAKIDARTNARRAIREGRLFREPCEVCGAAEVHAHHDDYSQPLNVRWLCPAHHRDHHAAERALQHAA